MYAVSKKEAHLYRKVNYDNGSRRADAAAVDSGRGWAGALFAAVLKYIFNV